MTGSTHPVVRRRLDLRGQVQGVGFRPFVYRLASEFGLGGHVANNSNGAVIEIEGPRGVVEASEEGLVSRLPPLAHISELLRREIDTLDEASFRIAQSDRDPSKRPEVTPDAATCRDCLAELFDPQDRRHRYPFINCTNCGPRYSIICTVPYDRPATTMTEFVMCPPCEREYTDPADRRFHAQPNACALCGPELRLNPSEPQSTDADPIKRAAGMLLAGQVLPTAPEGARRNLAPIQYPARFLRASYGRGRNDTHCLPACLPACGGHGADALGCRQMCHAPDQPTCPTRVQSPGVSV